MWAIHREYLLPEREITVVHCFNQYTFRGDFLLVTNSFSLISAISHFPGYHWNETWHTRVLKAWCCTPSSYNFTHSKYSIHVHGFSYSLYSLCYIYNSFLYPKNTLALSYSRISPPNLTFYHYPIAPWIVLSICLVLNPRNIGVILDNLLLHYLCFINFWVLSVLSLNYFLNPSSFISTTANALV